MEELRKPQSAAPEPYRATANRLIDQLEEFYKRESVRPGIPVYTVNHDFGPGGHHVVVARGTEVVLEIRSDAADDPAVEGYFQAIMRRLERFALPYILGDEAVAEFHKRAAERISEESGRKYTAKDRAATLARIADHNAYLDRLRPKIEAFIEEHPNGVGHATHVVKQVANALGGGTEHIIRVVGGADVFSHRCPANEYHPALDPYWVALAQYMSGGKPAPADPAVGEWQPRKAVDNG